MSLGHLVVWPAIAKLAAKRVSIEMFLMTVERLTDLDHTLLRADCVISVAVLQVANLSIIVNVIVSVIVSVIVNVIVSVIHEHYVAKCMSVVAAGV